MKLHNILYQMYSNECYVHVFSQQLIFMYGNDLGCMYYQSKSKWGIVECGPSSSNVIL
jgi:hypothetical protein